MAKNTPYAGWLPPLKTTEFEALKADIKDHGVKQPIDVDEDGNILDGHHRLKIDKNAPRNVVKNLDEGEKQAFVLVSGDKRRNMTEDQRRELLDRKKATAALLRESGKTQSQTAKLLGVSQPTVAAWEDRSNISADKGSKPDSRTKVAKEQHVTIAKRLADGETQSQVAADYGVSQRQVSNIDTKEKKRKADERQEKKNVALARKETAGKDQGVYIGDFRDHADKIKDGSVSLIFTDPPYDRKSMPLYGDLAEFGAAKLQVGGSLLCYAGHYLLGDILPLMIPHLRLWWVCCCRHTGNLARMDKLGVVVHWKPILWFVKETRGDKNTFVNDLVESSREKDTHKWQQGLIDAEYYIEHLTKPGDLVVDPFCGGGTTLVAAKRLKRRWRAMEISEPDAMKARKRIRDTTV